MRVTPLSQHVGAEISGVDLNDLDDGTVAEIRQVWLDHGVVFFRDQELTDASHVALAERFGEVVVPVIDSGIPPEVPGILVLDQVAPVGGGTDRWHSDSTFMERPPLGAILRAVVLPAVGGDTAFASMAAAYEALSEPMQAMLDGLTAVHSTRIVNEIMRSRGLDVDHRGGAEQSFVHPVVRTHPETGRKTLFVNGNFTTRIVELGLDESDAVLAMLREHVKSPMIQCRFHWTPGAVAFWDNRAVQHFASPDYTERRRMHPGAARRRPSPMNDMQDAVTAEVVRNALAVAAEEASIVVVRSSHSTFIQEGADACSAILDAKGQLVSQSTATSLMHGASLRCSLPALLEDHPLDTMVEGDVFAMNDPYRGGIHANDIVVFRPVFADGRPRWFAGTLIHVADVGGSAVGGLAALAQDCFSEGLLLPPIHLYAAGEARTEVFAILRRNSRAPEKVVGDVQALVAGANTMARRMDELIARYGADELERVVDEHLDATEARTRAGLRELAEGTYTGSFQVDADGLTNREYVVNVTVTLEDGTLTADFTGTSPQSGGAINASYSQTLSGVVFAMRCLVDPTLPMNEGCFRPLVANFPLGTLVNPAPPAACGGRIVTVAGATDAMLRALSDARPDKATAASGLIHVWTLSGAGWLSLFYEFGGIGGRAGSDGPDATGCFFLGGRSVIPQIEPMEAQYPFVVRHSKLLADSGGRGQWRGGLGMETEIELLDDAMITVRGARMEIAPPGSKGGEPGLPGSWSIRRLDGREEELAVRQADVPITKGERFIVRTSGGGGLGRPEDREPALVAADIRDGKVTA